MKQQLLLVVLLVIVGAQLSAQLSMEKLDLSTYSPAEQRYKNLYFNTITDYTANFETFRNTERTQVTTRFSGGFSSNFRVNGLSLQGSFQFESRNYVFKKAPKFFLLADVSMGIEPVLFDEIQHNFTLSSGLGYGRIHVVNEVEVAERILAQLQKDENNHSDDYQTAVIDLANLITELKNQRWLTNRGEWKSDLSSILDFLAARGYDTTDEKIINAITKEYRSEALISRKSGTLISYRGTNSVNPSSVFSVSFSDLKTTELSLGIDNNKYISSKLQWDSKFSAKYGRRRFILNNDLRHNSTYWGLDFSTALHYLPSKDSRFSTTLNATYTKSTDPLSVQYFGEEGFGISLGFEYEKRIGRNTRISVGAGFNYDQTNKFFISPTIGLKF